VTISSWLNFGRPAPPGRGSAVGGFWLCLNTAIADSVRLWGTAAGAQCLRLSERFFVIIIIIIIIIINKCLFRQINRSTRWPQTSAEAADPATFLQLCLSCSGKNSLQNSWFHIVIRISIKTNEKSAQRRCKLCALAVVRRRQNNFATPQTPSRARGTAKI